MSLQKGQIEYSGSRLNGGIKVQAGTFPHRDDQPVSFTEAAGGKPRLGLPVGPSSPRPVRRLGCNRGSGSSGELKWLPFFCQCQDCLETFSIEGLTDGIRITQLEEHRRVIQRNGGWLHRCGGNGNKEGRLVFYPEYPHRGDRRHQ